ncbi:hypothetical protein ACJX0J_015774 [Zea mays]
MCNHINICDLHLMNVDKLVHVDIGYHTNNIYILGLRNCRGEIPLDHLDVACGRMLLEVDELEIIHLPLQYSYNIYDHLHLRESCFMRLILLRIAYHVFQYEMGENYKEYQF